MHWRGIAVTLWVISGACLFAALRYGSNAEWLSYSQNEVSDATVRHLQTVAAVWAWCGWGLQAAAAIALSRGIVSEKMTRRIFVSLGILIAADGTLLLILAVILRSGFTRM
jgi:hypothetical protein